MASWADANPGKAHRMIIGPAMRAAARVLRRKQTPKEENTQPSRKLVQGRQALRSVSRSALLSGSTSGNAFRPPCSARTEEREISLTVPGDVSTLRLHRSSLSGITLSATKGHTLFLNTPWREHDCLEVCFRRNSPFVKISYETRQSKGCISKSEARQQKRLPDRHNLEFAAAGIAPRQKRRARRSAWLAFLVSSRRGSASQRHYRLGENLTMTRARAGQSTP
jgi:hypothetical protein